MTFSKPVETDGLEFTPEQWAFLRRMSHDLRTPLMTVLGTCQMLADGTYGETSPKQHKAVERALRNALHLQSLLTRAMTYVHLKSHTLILQSEPIPLLEVLNNLIAQSRNRLGDKPLTLNLVVAPGMPETVTGDPEQLAFIIRELLDNAVNFTPSGQVTIHVEAHDDQWKLSIQDTGIGIPSEDLGMVFTPFWRGPDAKMYAPQGDGLGLAVVRGLVRVMNGTIEILCPPGMGCSVMVSLPQVMPGENPPISTTV